VFVSERGKKRDNKIIAVQVLDRTVCPGADAINISGLLV